LNFNELLRAKVGFMFANELLEAKERLLYDNVLFHTNERLMCAIKLLLAIEVLYVSKMLSGNELLQAIKDCWKPINCYKLNKRLLKAN
jgi:hypothetical protein